MESFMAAVSFGKMIGAGWLAGWLAYLCNYGVKTPYGILYSSVCVSRGMRAQRRLCKTGEVKIRVGGDVKGACKKTV